MSNAQRKTAFHKTSQPDDLRQDQLMKTLVTSPIFRAVLLDVKRTGIDRSGWLRQAIAEKLDRAGMLPIVTDDEAET